MSQTTAVRLHILADLKPEQRAALLVRDAADLGAVMERVQPIIAAVRADGDAALARFAREFDGAPLDAGDIEATEADFEAAFETLEPARIEAIE